MASPDSPQSRSIKDQALAWHIRLHSGTTSASDRAAFDAWLALDADHVRVYRELERTWSRLGALRSRAAADLAAARAYRPLRRRRAAHAWAAALALGLALFTVVRFGVPGWPTEVHYLTAKGEQRNVALSDGSRMALNTDTELTVRYSPLRRSVQLHRGEALFEVTHQATRPFEVRAGSGLIRDIGTRFDVYENAGMVTVTVLEGEVRVEAGQRRQVLSAGFKASYGGNGTWRAGTAEDTAALTAWRDGKLVFRSRPLQEVAEQIARYHEVNLQIVSPELRDLKVSGSFATTDLPLLLTAIETSLPVKFVRVAPDTIRIEPHKR